MTQAPNYANYDYATGQEMQSRPVGQLDIFLAQQQTTVPNGAEQTDGTIEETSDA